MEANERLWIRRQWAKEKKREREKVELVVKMQGEAAATDWFGGRGRFWTSGVAD